MGVTRAQSSLSQTESRFKVKCVCLSKLWLFPPHRTPQGLQQRGDVRWAHGREGETVSGSPGDQEARKVGVLLPSPEGLEGAALEAGEGHGLARLSRGPAL